MKKLVALILVFVLTLAMMAPVFAAQPRVDGCAHAWVGEESTPLAYTMLSGTQHRVDYGQYKRCGLCNERVLLYTYSITENHWPPCYLCGCGV